MAMVDGLKYGFRVQGVSYTKAALPCHLDHGEHELCTSYYEQVFEIAFSPVLVLALL